MTPFAIFDENTALLSSSVILKNGPAKKSQNDDVSPATIRRQNAFGYLLIMLATVPYAINDIFIQTANTSYGLSAIGSLFVSSGTQALLAVTMILSSTPLRSSIPRIADQQLYLISVFGLLCALSVIFFAYALVRLPVGEADAILFLTPALTVLISYATLGEPISVPAVVAVLVSVVGAYAISLPSTPVKGAAPDFFSNDKRVEGVALALLGAFFLASSNIPIRAMGTSTSYLFSVLSFSLFLFVGTYLCGGYSVAFGDDTFSHMGIILSLGSGVSMFLGGSLYTQGIQRCPAGQGAFVGTVQIPVAIFLGFLFLGQIPTTVHFIGSVLVFSSALIIGAKQAFDRRASALLKPRLTQDDMV